MTSDTCSQCGGKMERGHATAIGVQRDTLATDLVPPLLFTVEGTRTSSQLVRAFQQGMSGEAGDRTYRIVGKRCASCGRLELYAEA